MSKTVAKYKKYAKYKDSGVEWMGEIPSQWYTVTLKMLIDVRDGTHDTPSYIEPNSNTYPLVTSKDVTSGRVDLTECKHISEFDYSNIIKRSGVSKGDILMPMIGTVGSPVLVEEVLEIAIKNLALFKTSISNQKLNSKFLFYFLNSSECEIQFSLEGKGGVQNFVSLGTLRNLVLPLTKISEQTQIANFLDHETAKIDSLITKQEKLIELLKEKRQAVISHAVTKGLNPDVTMKDSGVEWLGQVPASWLVTPLKYLIAPKRGAVKAGPFGSHLKNSDMEGQDIKVISQKNVIANDLNLGEAMISEKKYRELEVFTIEQDDVLVTTRGTIGRTCVFKENFKAILHPCLIRLQVDHNKVLPELIALIIQESGYEMEQILIKSNATTIEVIYSDNLINTVVVIPNSLEEQKQVLSYIDNQKAYFDKALKKANQMIQKLIERRTALISSAVIGKIDVRNWQNPNYNNNEANTELGA